MAELFIFPKLSPGGPQMFHYSPLPPLVRFSSTLTCSPKKTEALSEESDGGQVLIRYLPFR